VGSAKCFSIEKFKKIRFLLRISKKQLEKGNSTEEITFNKLLSEESTVSIF